MSAFYDLASLVLVPSGYKASKVYAQKPLTTDGQLTFSRASTATRVNSAGLIETVSSNVPRLDYLGSTCPKLLLEPQRVNLAIQNTAFDNAAWTKTDVTVTANAAASPDGTTNADAVIEDTAASTGRRVLPTLPFTGTGGAYYTFSVYVKKIAGQPTRHIYWMCQFGVNAVYAHYNMTTFTVNQVTNSGNGSNASATITAVGNDWYRLTLSGIVSSGGGDYYNQFYFEDTVRTGFNPQSYTGNGTSGFYLYGWQIEQGAYVTSLIPTTSSAVTRLADDLGTINMAVLTPGSAYSFFFEITESVITTASSWMFLGSSTGSGDPFQIYAGTAILNTSSGYVYPFSFSSSSNASGKVCVSYNGTTVAVFLNGVKQGQWTASTIWANKTTLDLTRDQLQKINYKKVLTFPSALTDAQCIELTAL